MNVMIRSARRSRAALTLAISCSALLVLCGCHAPSSAVAAEKPAADTKEKASAEAEPAEGLALKPEEIEKMGVVTEEAKAITHAPEAQGFGVVIAHEVIAQAVAELRTAVAVERQSHSAFERTRHLAGTPGAMPADAQETAERQATVDQASLELVKRRLSSTFGQNPPWKLSESNPQLTALASGETKLVRVTFPLGSVGDANPRIVRVTHISGSAGAQSWDAAPVWKAQADTTLPGKSYFSLLKSSDASEGERLLAWAPVGDPELGVFVPAAAVLISAGKYWAYVEEKPGTFVKTEIDPGMPMAGGYFVKEGISAGDKIVTHAAGQLLAREMNPSTEAE